jgi:CBS domain-containing protein
LYVKKERCGIYREFDRKIKIRGGVSNMKVREFMKRDVVSILPDSSIMEAARRMEEYNIGCLMVMEGGESKGILTDRDIVLKVVARGSQSELTKVADIMHPQIISATPEMDVLEASRLMSVHHVRRLPVIEYDQVVGIISAMDLAHVVQEEVDNLFSLRGASAYT